MTLLPRTSPLLESRQAAVARLAYAAQRAGAVAVLCGPPGVGTSTVLSLLAASPAFAPRSCALRPLCDWNSTVPDAHLPDIVLADDAHAGDAAIISSLLSRCRQRTPAASLVLAGHGRLLSLIARDTDLERAVLLRAVLQPFTFPETRCVLDATLFNDHGLDLDEPRRQSVARTLHEIAAGIPAAVFRLADLSAVVATGRSDRGLEAADIEAIDRRLGVRAA